MGETSIHAAYAQRMLDEWWTPEVFAKCLARNAHVVAERDGEVVAMANLGRLAASYRALPHLAGPHVTGDRDGFYRAHGFEEVERVSDDGPFPDDIWMVKQLRRDPAR